MKIALLVVGPGKSGPEQAMVDDYAKRFSKLSGPLGLSGLDITSVKSGGGLKIEGERLLAKLPGQGKIIRLDEHGPAWPSTKLAKNIANWRDDGERALTFLIGGAEGYSDAVQHAAPTRLALGPQTWPHMLVRAMITEQIYRAASILARTPYHKA